MKKRRVNCFGRKVKYALLTAFAGVFYDAAMAQADGNNGISQANQMVRSYFATGVDLMYGVGGIVGLIGAVKVYNKWSHGEPDTARTAANWFGSCIFLVIVATVIKSFFGIQ